MLSEELASKNLDFEEGSDEFNELEAAAKNGDPYAQHAFGMWHEEQGNLEEAQRLYKYAAGQGLDYSEQALEELLEKMQNWNITWPSNTAKKL